MRFNEVDRDYLRSKGCNEQEIKQIEEMSQATVYRVHNSVTGDRNDATEHYVIELIGRQGLLAELQNSWRYYSSIVRLGNVTYLVVDSSKWFKDMLYGVDKRR